LSKKNIYHSQRNNKEIIEYISKNVINNQYFKITPVSKLPIHNEVMNKPSDKNNSLVDELEKTLK
jgi:hypothetical protein